MADATDTPVTADTLRKAAGRADMIAKFKTAADQAIEQLRQNMDRLKDTPEVEAEVKRVLGSEVLNKINRLCEVK